MTIEISTGLANARLQGVINFLDTGAGNAAVRIYGSTRAASVDDVPGSAMLVQVALSKPCGTVTGGVLTLTQLENGMVANSGTATWARVVNGDGDTAFDADAGEGAGAWEVQLALATVYAGGDAQIVSAVLG